MQLISQPTALEAHFYTWNSDTVETEDEIKERQRLVRRQRFSNGFTGPRISHPSRCRLDMGRYRRCSSDGGSRSVRGQLSLQLTMLRGRPDGIALLLTEIITGWVCLRRANRSQICARLGEKVSQAEVPRPQKTGDDGVVPHGESLRPEFTTWTQLFNRQRSSSP
ncbi:hypothetical protein T02_8834 [Trichinella nativa]|uniref:Uncharacterized protein n=1 Tax=Trichinella nativa TaxID=6335 RepID=A0A0V1LGB6_9BILA|nr:hypothetical protein T02_8834 [Trichinella nativa]